MRRVNRLPWAAISLIVACASGKAWVLTPPPDVIAANDAIRAAIGNERAIDASTFPAGAVGVAPFRIVSSDTALAVLGFGLADLVMTDLSRSSQLKVVDRLRMDALLREMNLVSAGYVDSIAGPRVGRIIGARRIVLGSLTSVGADRARLDARIGDVVSGTIDATEGTGTSLNAVLDAEKTFVFSVFDRMGVVLTPGERALVEQRPTRSLAALLAYSRGLRAEVMLNYQQAGREYREALRSDSRFGNARSNLGRLENQFGAGLSGTSDLLQVGALALESVNASTMPLMSSSADPAFRQRLNTVTIIIILKLP